MSCLVNVNNGVLQGKSCVSNSGKKYYSFEGIPYAKPPIRNLRFRNPEEPDNWDGIRDATKPGHKCAQINPYNLKPIEGSEDCLYLNVYTPNLPADKIEKLPVLFYLHGGRFILGHGDYYKPDYFIRHDIILVTCNYRLNVLGFLCLDIPEAPGNVGLKDTVMALRWVKTNISKFNGDHDNVTAFGESAGGAVVLSYLTSEMAFGLCKRIISESSSVLSDLYMLDENPVEKGAQIASLLGQDLKDPRSIYECLANAPLEDLLTAFATAEVSRPPYIINAFFLPVVEKKFEGVERFFDEYPLATIKKNHHQKLPILIGFSSHEGALFLHKDENGDIVFEKDLRNFIPRYLFLKHESAEMKKLADKLHEFYFKGKPLDNTLKLEYVDFYSDVFFNRDIIYFIEMLSKQTDIYLYRFSYQGNMSTRIMRNIGVKGATHGDIIQYQFYRKSKAEQCSGKDKQIVDFLSEAWAGFARNGEPTTANAKFKWPLYKQKSRLCLEIGDQIKIIPNPYWNRIKFWLDNMGERAKL